MTDKTRAAILREYGLPVRKYGKALEIDHIVPLEIGGSNDPANLYAEAAAPGLGYHVKDRLERRLKTLVCEKTMPLRNAQRAIGSNWVTLYKQLFGITG